MTAVVAVAASAGGEAVIGSDACVGSADGFVELTALPKWFRLGPATIGFAGDMAAAARVARAKVSAVRKGQTLANWPATHLAPVVAAMDLKEDSLDLLIVVGGAVFTMDEGGGLVRPLHGYAAIGSGGSAALGALAATEGLAMSAVDRVRLALDAAERHAAGVRGPMSLAEVAR
jgi:ATP-dependent protease HslVU (ClpYQ) peptidase subunit